MRASRFARRPSKLPVTITALAIVLALAYVFFLRTPAQPAAPQVRSIAGVATWSAAAAGGGSGGSAPFAVAAGPGYVARTAAAMAAGGGPDDPGPPHPGGAPDPLTYAGYAAVVRSAAQSHDRQVGLKPLRQGGRPVWRAAMSFAGDTVELVVDQRSGIVLWWVRQGASGLPRRQFTVTRIAYDGAAASPAPAASARSGAATPAPAPSGPTPVAPQRLYVPAPAGGVRFYGDLRAAAAAAGFAPLTSDLAPDGYRLAAVDVGPAARLRGLGAAPAQPARRLDLLYVRGLSAFTVSEVRSPAGAGWREAVQRAASGRLAFRTTPVQYGRFAGAAAGTWFAPGGPGMLLTGRGYTVLVRGGLTRQELLDLSAGFRRAASS